MAIEYDLTLAGVSPVGQVAERALPDLDERPTGIPPLLAADLDGKYGFDITVTAARNAYIAVESDNGLWEWEPEDHVSLTFRLDKEADREWAVTNVLTVVRRVLKSGPEDAAFVVNSDVLLFTRLGGELVKHNRERWWSYHPAADQLIAN